MMFLIVLGKVGSIPPGDYQLNVTKARKLNLNYGVRYRSRRKFIAVASERR